MKQILFNIPFRSFKEVDYIVDAIKKNHFVGNGYYTKKWEEVESKYYKDYGNYEGEIVNGVPHGQGTLTYYNFPFPNGTKYEGEFELGKPKKKAVVYETKEKHRILISSKKVIRTGWVKEKNRLEVEEKLKRFFAKKASKACSSTKNFEIIQQNIVVVEFKQMSKLLSNEKYNVYRLDIDGEVACN